MDIIIYSDELPTVQAIKAVAESHGKKTDFLFCVAELNEAELAIYHPSRAKHDSTEPDVASYDPIETRVILYRHIIDRTADEETDRLIAFALAHEIQHHDDARRHRWLVKLSAVLINSLDWAANRLVGTWLATPAAFAARSCYQLDYWERKANHYAFSSWYDYYVVVSYHPEYVPN